MWKHSLLLLPLFLISSTSINRATADESSGAGSGEGNCNGGESLTLLEECAPTCRAGFIWCDPGQQCIVDDKDYKGYKCDCLPGYYKDNITESCEVGRFFGGRIFFNDTSTRSAGLELKTKDILFQIYNSSPYYYNSTVLHCANDSYSCSYQLIYQNAEVVDVQYLEDEFVNKTRDCSPLNDIATEMDCVRTRDSGLDQSIVCGSYGSFSDICDPDTAKCNASDSGGFYCECKPSYALPYSGATSCTVIKCKEDGDCSGGGIHGTCKVNDQSPVDNFCQCNWGFTGNSCEDPWWFVFTVLTGAFGVLAIVILVACICMSTKTKTVKTDVQKDDLDLKNPFVDFQPGVRAKVSTNIYSSVTDSISSPTTHGHSNPAFNNNAYDERDKATPYAAAAQGNDYF